MIQRLEMSAIHTKIDDKLRSYVERKLGHLDRYMARSQRPSAHLEVRLKESKALKHEDHKKQFNCEVVLHLPHETIEVSETTLNLYTAIDIVEAKLKQQIIKHKQIHGGGSLRRRLAARFSRKSNAAS